MFGLMSYVPPLIIGQRPVVTAEFTDVEGGNSIATAVTFKTLDPTGVEVVYPPGSPNVVEVGDNVWAFTMPVLNRRGEWRVRVEATSGLIAAAEATLPVRRSAFAT